MNGNNGNNQKDPNRLQNEFLHSCCENEENVRLFLSNGVRLVGIIKDYDMFSVLLDSEDKGSTLVYKHAISSVTYGDK